MSRFSRNVPKPAVALCLGLLLGCTQGDRVDLVRQTGGSAALFGQFQSFDGHTGQAISFDEVAARANRADVVLFGEEHSDVVCNALEAQLLAALAGQPRPVTLAMEFFESDTQVPLDAYLSGRIDEAEFRKLTRQKRAYVTSHRPMIEYCRKASIPVIAANAPWRLTRALRLSGKPYDEFLAGLEPSDRAWIARSSELLEGPYHDRFVEAMSGHEMPPTSGPASQPTSRPSSQPSTAPASSQPTSQPDHAEQILRAYRAQSLWDDTMAESIADHRARLPIGRVMLIVGGFHVASEGGTQVKLRRRRPCDSICTIVYHGTDKTPLAFDDANKADGDVLIYGITPPEEKSPEKPGPTSAPTTMPTAAPTTSKPAS
jgi:uncharacterized iron-regulated protein